MELQQTKIPPWRKTVSERLAVTDLYCWKRNWNTPGVTGNLKGEEGNQSKPNENRYCNDYTMMVTVERALLCYLFFSEFSLRLQTDHRRHLFTGKASVQLCETFRRHSDWEDKKKTFLNYSRYLCWTHFYASVYHNREFLYILRRYGQAVSMVRLTCYKGKNLTDPSPATFCTLCVYIVTSKFPLTIHTADNTWQHHYTH